MNMPIAFWLAVGGILLPAGMILSYPLWRDRSGAFGSVTLSIVAVLSVFAAGSVALYYPYAFNYEAAMSAQRMVEETEHEYVQRVAAIRRTLETQSEKAEPWLQLAEAHANAGRFELAFSAYDEAERRRSLAPAERYAYAEVIVWSRDDKRLDKARSLLDSILAQRDEIERPRYLAVLWLSGVVFSDQKNYSAAVRDWRLLLNALPDDADQEIRAHLLDGIHAAESRIAEAGETNASEAHTTIHVVVDIAEKLKPQQKPGDTLLVYAKAVQGPPMPLAVVRLPASRWPTTVTLDHTQAMVEGMSLDDVERVVVTARVSAKGLATPQSGDLFGVSEAVDARHTPQVHVTIDRLTP